jgi:hypothetical protein
MHKGLKLMVEQLKTEKKQLEEQIKGQKILILTKASQIEVEKINKRLEIMPTKDEVK